MTSEVKLIESLEMRGRDCRKLIPAEYKAEYLRNLCLQDQAHDAVSFVSPKRVKQMADSEEVMAKFNASLPAGVEPRKSLAS